MKILPANKSHQDKIRAIHLKAFTDEENTLVADLACSLIETASSPECIHLIAEEDDQPIGHIAFSPVHSKNTDDLIAYILAPLAVDPSHQGKGIGTALIKEGLKILKDKGIHVILVYGDPAFYSRFGFKPEPAERYVPPCKLSYPFGWQAIDRETSSSNSSRVEFKCVEPLNKPELW